MKKTIHPIAGIIAISIIAINWLSTALSEAFGSIETVTLVKTAIPWGLLILVPAIAATGASGMAMAGKAKGGLIGAKRKRMPIIAANGILILIPAALYLASKARAGEFDTGFYVVQVLELVAGAVNFTLMVLNARDGRKLAGSAGQPGKITAEVALISSEEVADGTMAFRFTRPEGLAFQAGQWARLTLSGDGAPAGKDAVRTFTIASAPEDDHLMFATRMRPQSAFKQALRAMAPGAKLRLTAPGGDLVLPAETARPVVMLAGGIGITPFLSMIRHADATNWPQKITLIYANRLPKDAAFLAELEAISARNPRIEVVATMTDPAAAEQGWTGETGRISVDLVSRHVIDMDAPIWYIAGPAAMTSEIGGILRGWGVLERNIRSEDFYGY